MSTLESVDLQSPSCPSEETFCKAEALYRLLGRRQDLLGTGIFFDPAWNMLLDIFITTGRGSKLSVSAACIGSRASAATALRYLALLIESGLVQRVPDKLDGRRSFVELTDRAMTTLDVLLANHRL